MTCAAVSGGSASKIIPDTISISQTNSGIRMSVIPLQRMLTVVAMTLMADDGIVAGPSGVMRITPEKYGEMTREGDWNLKSFEFDDLEVVFPADDVAVIAYKVHQVGEMKGGKMDLRCADTSTWVKRDGEWKCSAHTETVLEDRAKAA